MKWGLSLGDLTPVLAAGVEPGVDDGHAVLVPPTWHLLQVGHVCVNVHS